MINDSTCHVADCSARDPDRPLLSPDFVCRLHHTAGSSSSSILFGLAIYCVSILPHPIIISSSLFLAVASEREQLCKCNQGS